MNSKQIISAAHTASDDKQGIDPVILDIRKLTDIADYFLLVHGNSDRHVRAIAQNIMDTLEEKGVSLWHVEGMDGGRWVLLDFGDVIAHVFYHETREFYSLERLWGDAPEL